MSSPAIRFAGFTEDWEQRKLYEISDKVMEKNVNRAYTETLTNSAEFGIISQRDFFDKNIANNDNIDGYYIVRHNDFVYNPRISTFAPVGPIKRNKLGRSGIMSPLYYVFRTHDIDQTYLEHFFATAGWHKFMAFNGDSGARSDRFSIKNSVFREMPLPYPSIAEQKKIGKQCDTLDRLITLHQREHDKTVNIKKALLEKMFPKDGEDKPEIRFAGFTASWERRDIGACFSERNERSGTGDLISVTMNSGVMRAEDLGRHDTSSNDKSNYKKVEVGDIAYNSMRMWQGASGYSPYSGILSPAYTVIIPQEGMHSPFFAYLFKRSNMIHQFQMNSQGLTSDTWNLKWPSLRTICVIIPEFEEQRRISELFAGIDRLITIHQCELTKLQNIKKALLEKMFV